MLQHLHENMILLKKDSVQVFQYLLQFQQSMSLFLLGHTLNSQNLPYTSSLKVSCRVSIVSIQKKYFSCLSVPTPDHNQQTHQWYWWH